MECEARRMVRSRHWRTGGSAYCSGEEMITSRHSEDIYYIFWTGPQKLHMRNFLGACWPTGTPVVHTIASIVLYA